MKLRLLTVQSVAESGKSAVRLEPALWDNLLEACRLAGLESSGRDAEGLRAVLRRYLSDEECDGPG